MAPQRVPEGPAPAPAVQKLRLRYAKRGRLRFSSTRDFQRALERALRRADVPMAFSAGFHPHPRISYANAAPTGTASEAEYVEISVTERVDPEAVRAALDEALPAGLDVVEVVEAAPGALADRLQASDWVIAFRDVGAERLQAAADTLLALDRIEVTRTFKTGPRTFDVRSAVVRMTVADETMVAAVTEAFPQALPTSLPDDGAGCAILRVVVRHTTPAVRPDDILTALKTAADLEPPTPPLVTRLAQGPLRDASAEVADPLAADETAGGS
ncbi:TIGR03936 family radical SAM-associated protein [Lapillicoccus sp.]|uniref:TIGR03936 family radical SAM-associated protein n=1 Tax=Lapillicoccus sp. TaxID=1909287 RepID=UPI0032658A5A